MWHNLKCTFTKPLQLNSKEGEKSPIKEHSIQETLENSFHEVYTSLDTCFTKCRSVDVQETQQQSTSLEGIKFSIILKIYTPQISQIQVQASA